MYQTAHIGIRVEDLEQSLQFYKEILNCQEQYRIDDGRVKIVFLKSGQNVLELIQLREGQEKRSSTGFIDHIAFKVDNMVEEVNRLKDKGVECISEAPRDFDGGKMKIFFFKGPDGEILEFVE